MGGIWRHKSTGDLYFVMGLASDSNNVSPRKQLQVIYISLNWHQEYSEKGGPPLHNRDLSEFIDRFEPTGYTA